MRTEHLLFFVVFFVLGITPKSMAKVCAQWNILKPPVACAADRSKAVIWVLFLLH